MKTCCRIYQSLGLNYCGICEPRVLDEARGCEKSRTRYVTVGRKKRKRKPGAGRGVKIRSHTRSPRGPNKGKKPVRVDGYARGKAPKKSRRRKR